MATEYVSEMPIYVALGSPLAVRLDAALEAHVVVAWFEPREYFKLVESITNARAPRIRGKVESCLCSKKQ